MSRCIPGLAALLVTPPSCSHPTKFGYLGVPLSGHERVMMSEAIDQQLVDKIIDTDRRAFQGAIKRPASVAAQATRRPRFDRAAETEQVSRVVVAAQQRDRSLVEDLFTTTPHGPPRSFRPRVL